MDVMEDSRITDSDMPAIDVIAVLGQGKSSRLFQTLKEQSGLVHNISAYSYTPSHAGVSQLMQASTQIINKR